jgi:hypothetical protein
VRRLRLAPIEMAITRLEPGAEIPAWAWSGGWSSVTRTADEVSLVHSWEFSAAGGRRSGPWRMLTVDGKLSHDLVGVLLALIGPLAAAGVPVFVLSTYDTDHVLIPSPHLDAAVAALTGAGHLVIRPPAG